MEKDEIWLEIRRQRHGVADLLEQLSPAEWSRPSLCGGWTVRDVAAHLTLAPDVRMRDAVVEFTRARGSFNRMVYDTARRRAAAARPEQLIADLRRIAETRRLAPVQREVDPMMDILVHSQDIVLPLGRHRPMPLEPARISADKVWRVGFPFHARRRLRGFHLEATDVSWANGAGALVAGPIEAILLLLTGRTVSLPRLTGDGAAELIARLAAGPPAAR